LFLGNESLVPSFKNLLSGLKKWKGQHSNWGRNKYFLMNGGKLFCGKMGPPNENSIKKGREEGWKDFGKKKWVIIGSQKGSKA